MDELSGKVSLVTGASRGIGRAMAIALGAAGVDVAVNYLRQEGADRETCERVTGAWTARRGHKATSLS